jgi:site-specific recombinase XerD/ribosomal protein L40E
LHTGEDALAFINNLEREGISELRIARYARMLMILDKVGDYRNVGRQGVERFLDLISNYDTETRNMFIIMVKRFYKWLLGKDEEYPDCVKWIKRRASVKESNVLPEHVLRPEEALMIANQAEHIRDKAFVMCLYESGTRPEEFLTLRKSDVTFDKYGSVRMVNGKTGMRRIMLVASSPLLASWIEQHPMKPPDAPLWVTLTTNYKNKLLGLTGAAKLVQKLVKKAGIDKRVTLYLFRHSRATELANILTEAQMCEFFGWVIGSRAPRRYIHLSGRNVDSALLAASGIQEEDKKEQMLKVKDCYRCGYRNPPTASFCMKCALALDIKGAMQTDKMGTNDDKVQALADVLIELARRIDPALVSKLENALKNYS